MPKVAETKPVLAESTSKAFPLYKRFFIQIKTRWMQENVVILYYVHDPILVSMFMIAFVQDRVVLDAKNVFDCS